MQKLTHSQSHRLHPATVAALLRAIRRIGIRRLKRRVEMVKPQATQEPLPWDEPGPSHSVAWLRCLGAQDQIKEEAFENVKAPKIDRT